MSAGTTDFDGESRGPASTGPAPGSAFHTAAERDAHSTRIINSRWFLAVFAMILVVTAVFSWRIFSRVQENVIVADAGVRTVVWALLLYADEHGVFPDRNDGVLNVAWSASLDGHLADGAAWPTEVADIDDAGASALPGAPPAAQPDEWASRLRASLDVVLIQRARDGDGPPRLSTPGYGTSLGMLHDANTWLAGAYDALRTTQTLRLKPAEAVTTPRAFSGGS